MVPGEPEVGSSPRTRRKSVVDYGFNVVAPEVVLEDSGSSVKVEGPNVGSTGWVVAQTLEDYQNMVRLFVRVCIGVRILTRIGWIGDRVCPWENECSGRRRQARR